VLQNRASNNEYLSVAVLYKKYVMSSLLCFCTCNFKNSIIH